MPTLSKPTRLPCRCELGHCPPPASSDKPGHCPEVPDGEDNSCMLSLPLFTTTDDFWQHYYPSIFDHHDLPPAESYESRDRQQSGMSRTELSRLSSRPYSLRVADPSDFAHVWETSLIPRLTKTFQQHCTSDYAVDVHNFPELSSDSVPRVIYVTLPDNTADDVAHQLEQTIRSEVARDVPARFSPLYLRFRRGSLQRSTQPSSSTASRGWWGETEKGERDHVCPPKNASYQATPVMGMSIGPAHVCVAASLGGFVRVGSELYAMSAFHAFESSLQTCHLRVCHPAEPDLPGIVSEDPRVRPYSIGNLAMWAPQGTLRPSLTFQETNLPEDSTMVEMDWCLIGPAAEGRNFVPVPSFQMNRVVAVQSTAAVEGNTEVYAMARTSGYSLGFTSDTPGLLRYSGRLQREWTVRQYSPFKRPKESVVSAPWQTLKQWVTSGIGVPGDSGAWLVRRSDNALIGFIWGRNHDCGNPLERVRLTYFTPMIDILADIKQNHTTEEEVALPAYSTRDLGRVPEVRHPREAVQRDMSQDPWSVLGSSAIQENRRVEAHLIRSHFVGGGVPASGTILHYRQGIDAHQAPTSSFGGEDSTTGLPDLIESVAAGAAGQTTPPRSEGDGSVSRLGSQGELLLGMGLGVSNDPSLPELSASSSIRSGTNLADETCEEASRENGVRIADEGDIEDNATAIVDEPIRSKACFPPAFFWFRNHGVYPEGTRTWPNM